MVEHCWCMCEMCVCGGGYGLLTEKSINKFVVIESILCRSMKHYNNILKLQKHITFCVSKVFRVTECKLLLILKKCLISILRPRERCKISIIMLH